MPFHCAAVPVIEADFTAEMQHQGFQRRGRIELKPHRMQLFFGWAGDKFGRKSVYGFTLILMVGCSFGQALSFGATATAVITTLCVFRFFLGFGIGGDYPLSATIMSEYANTKTRGAFIAAVFAQQVRA